MARLDGFISTFIDRNQQKNPHAPKQKVDDAFKSFVWRHIFRLENVRVGVLERTLPPSQIDAEDPTKIQVDEAGPSTSDTPAPAVTSVEGFAIEEHDGSTRKTGGLAGKPDPPPRSANKKDKKASEGQKEWIWRELGPEEKSEGREVLAMRYASTEPGDTEGRLRIATDPGTCLRAMIGSDNRVSSLSVL